MPLCQMFILSPILMHGGKAAEPPQVAHTSRSLECMRDICDVEWRDARAEGLLRREPCSLFNPSAYRRVRPFDSGKIRRRWVEGLGGVGGEGGSAAAGSGKTVREGAIN